MTPFFLSVEHICDDSMYRTKVHILMQFTTQLPAVNNYYFIS